MAGRPKPDIIMSQTTDTGTLWEIIEADRAYVLTYQGRPVGIRITEYGISGQQRKYRKTSYNNLGNCLLAVRRLNERFNTTDFGYITI